MTKPISNAMTSRSRRKKAGDEQSPVSRNGKPGRSSVRRATVAELRPTGEVLVELDGTARPPVLCDFLETSATPSVALQVGDAVLVLASADGKGCVLGKIGRYRAPDTRRVELTADEELTIRCGEGAIIIRKNGQILIDGLDVVSHAERSNRIRGGSVKLN